MVSIRYLPQMLFTLLFFLVSACGGGSSNGENNSNQAPTANAGVDLTVITNQSLQLSADLSTDPENDILSYSWLLISSPSGSNTSLNNAAIADPIITPDIDGLYMLQLIVSDGQLASVADTVSITSSANTPVNTAPTANAGADQAVTTSQSVQVSQYNSVLA